MRVVIADQEISAKAKEYMDLQRELESAGVFDRMKRLESLKKELVSYLDKDEKNTAYSVEFSTGVLADLKVTLRKALDQGYFKLGYPEIYDQCLKEQRVRSLTVSPRD